MKSSKTKKPGPTQRQLLELQIREYIARHRPDLRNENVTIDISPSGSVAAVRKAQASDRED